MKKNFLYRRHMKGRLMYNIDPRRESQIENGWYFCIFFLRRIQPEISKTVLAYPSPKDDQLLRFSVVIPHKYQHQSPLEIIARLNRGASDAVVYRNIFEPHTSSTNSLIHLFLSCFHPLSRSIHNDNDWSNRVVNPSQGSCSLRCRTMAQSWWLNPETRTQTQGGGC